jgi:hypothetical protein
MNQYEIDCLNNADFFVAVRGSKSSSRIRQEFSTIECAKEFATKFGDHRTMIYAVTKFGNFAHICNA